MPTLPTPIFTSSNSSSQAYLDALSRKHVLLSQVAHDTDQTEIEPAKESQERISKLIEQAKQALQEADHNPANGKWYKITQLLADRLQCTRGGPHFLSLSLPQTQAEKAELAEETKRRERELRGKWCLAETEEEWANWEKVMQRRADMRNKVEDWREQVQPDAQPHEEPKPKAKPKEPNTISFAVVRRTTKADKQIADLSSSDFLPPSFPSNLRTSTPQTKKARPAPILPVASSSDVEDIFASDNDLLKDRKRSRQFQEMEQRTAKHRRIRSPSPVQISPQLPTLVELLASEKKSKPTRSPSKRSQASPTPVRALSKDKGKQKATETPIKSNASVQVTKSLPGFTSSPLSSPPPSPMKVDIAIGQTQSTLALPFLAPGSISATTSGGGPQVVELIEPPTHLEKLNEQFASHVQIPKSNSPKRKKPSVLDIGDDGSSSSPPRPLATPAYQFEEEEEEDDLGLGYVGSGGYGQDRIESTSGLDVSPAKSLTSLNASTSSSSSSSSSSDGEGLTLADFTANPLFTSTQKHDQDQGKVVSVPPVPIPGISPLKGLRRLSSIAHTQTQDDNVEMDSQTPTRTYSSKSKRLNALKSRSKSGVPGSFGFAGGFGGGFGYNSQVDVEGNVGAFDKFLEDDLDFSAGFDDDDDV